MNDQRIKRLAELLLEHSVAVKSGEVLYLEWKGSTVTPLIEEIIKSATKHGAVPVWTFHDEKFLRPVVENLSPAQVKEYGRIHSWLMENSQCYIGINGSDNPFEMATLGAKQSETFTKNFSDPVHSARRLRHTRWCVTRWPSPSMAQMAQMPHEEFVDFFFDVCLVDYKKMSKEMDPLVKRLRATDKVRIKGPGTDLTFSIKGIPVIKCEGRVNIPDGEVFTAPVAGSMNGRITFNTPAMHRGLVFSNITMEFKNGRAEKISCDGNDPALQKIFGIDEGARRCGEFAIGLNPKITRPMKDPLFDEKIDGSIHLALGQCYDSAPNGNKSSIHWDLVHIQTPAYGGGEIYFDGKLVRKNGKFVT
jgi:aminopeptidase